MKHFFSFLIFTIINIQATRAQSVSYKVIKDDPKNFKPFSLSIEPFNAGMYMGNALIGARLRADVILLKRLEVRFDYNHFYLDLEGDNDNLSKSKGMEIGGSLYLINREKNRKIDVTLSSSSYGGKTYREYLNIPGHKFVMIGVRGGMLIEGTNFNSKLGGDIYGLNTKNSYDTLNTGAFGDVTTKLNSFIIYGGLSRKGITDLIAEVEGYSKNKGKKLMHDLYADVMLGTALSVANVNFGGNEYEIKTKKSGVKQYLGWRIGWMVRAPSKVNFTAKMEFGSKPQINTGDTFSGYYGFVGFGLNIPMTIKALQNIGKKDKVTE